MEFEQINVACDKTPIVLIDNSGSTANYLKDNNILQNEIIKMKSIMEQKNITEIYLMFWDDNKILVNGHNLTNINSIVNTDYKPCGGTNLAQALNAIPDSWYNNKEVCDIYVFTDGEIGDRPIVSIQKTLSKSRMYIITVESSFVNYNNGDCNAGNRMFGLIRDNNLTGQVKRFISYNEYHFDQPFISLNNPDVPHGYVPFMDKIFKMTNMNHFMIYIDNLIANTEDNHILKLTHELSLTVSHIIKNKPAQIQRQTINLFCNLFAHTKEYEVIRNILLDEVDNHIKGKATTFQSYKRNRGKVFENAQLSLYEDVKQNISNVPNKNYASFILDTEENTNIIIKTSNKNIKDRIIIGNRVFNNSGYNINKYNVPILPLDIKLDHDKYDQCVRQWIRANYAKKFNVNVASDLVLYYFLADAMRVFISDVSEELKKSYRDLVYLMLDRKRFGTDITEYVYLQSNAPEAVVGNTSKINYILYKTMKFVGLINQDVKIIENDEQNNILDDLIIKPLTFWYGFILLFGDETLINTQYIFCEPSLTQDKITKDNLIQFMKTHLKKITEIDCSDIYNYDYTCYITLDDTENDGGYIIPPHRVSKNIVCSPNMVLSENGYNSLQSHNNNKCPICYTELELGTYKKVPPKHITEKEEFERTNKAVPQINEPYYDTNNFDIVNITEDIYIENNIPELVLMDECNFSSVAYTINSPHLQEALGTRTVEVRTQDEFNKSVYFKYPFLKEVNFDNIVLAGGFCRSILLRQKMKDFDFFVYQDDTEDPNAHMKTFTRLLTEVQIAIKKQYPNIKFLTMYKHLFNVYEVVCVVDPNGFFKDGFTLDNFDKYKFKSLHHYDKDTIIDPETGKVYRKKKYSKVELTEDEINELIKNRDFSNYFEDGDITGVQMKYRLQFILTKNKSIKHIFENFDIYPSCVAFDGKHTYFTNKSEQAYKYMINVVNERNYSTLFDHRLSKYFTYGFTIVLPELNIDSIRKKQVFDIGKNAFNIIHVIGQSVMVETNSHLLSQLSSIEALEKKNLKEGKSLYKSSLFCSLVSLLRYVKINNISYLLTNEPVSLNHEDKIKFRETEEQIKFIDFIDSRIANNDYYGKFRKGYSRPSKKSVPDKEEDEDPSSKQVSETDDDDESEDEP